MVITKRQLWGIHLPAGQNPKAGFNMSVDTLILNNGSSEADILQQTVEKFDIWRDKGFADIPEEQWMTIPYKDCWEDTVDQSGCVYSAAQVY